jgi:hypothetical protein
MHPIVPIVGFSGHLALQALAGGGSAISQEARAVYERASQVVASAERSQVLFGDKAAALSRLAALEAECAENGWNGEGATAIDPVAVLSATRFLRAMPDGMRLPEFAPEPDGSISLDWILSRTRLFSLSVGRTNRIAYAWLDGTETGHAVAVFDGQTIPSRILEGIRSILDRHAAIRAS